MQQAAPPHPRTPAPHFPHPPHLRTSAPRLRPPARRGAPVRAVWVALLVLSAAAPADARERVFRLFDQRDGLPAGEVVRLAQDSRGFIWLGSFAGLVRYDGVEMRPWAPDRLSGHISVLITGPAGEVVVRVEPGREGDVDPTTLYRIVPDGFEPVAGPEGRPLSGVGDAAFGGDGMLCAAQGMGVLCRLRNGDWVRHPLEGVAPAQAETATVLRGTTDGVLAATAVGIWLLDARGSRRQVAAIQDAIKLVQHPDGALIACTFDAQRVARLVRIADGATTVEAVLPARPIDLTIRGDVVWATFDRYLAAFRPGEPAELVGPEDITSGGPLLVDHEGGLWLGTYRGVMYMPEPEAVLLTERDGLPSTHTRFLAFAGTSMWVGTWQGLGRIELAGRGWTRAQDTAPGADRFCLDGRNRLWNVQRSLGIQRHEPGRRTLFRNPEIEGWLGCHRRADGRVWLTTSAGLHLTPPDDGPPRRLSANPDDPAEPIFFRHVLEDRRGRLWVATGTQICAGETAAVEAGRESDWRCQRIPEARGISAIVALDDGDLWLATDRVGVWRYDERAGTWSQMPGSSTLPSHSLRGLVVSSDGTVWILGHGTVVRVRDDHQAAAGWTVVERLTGLHGLPSAAAEDLVERPDGSLWIATIVGLVHVPARARRTTLPPPAVEMVAVLINGEPARGPAPSRLAADDRLELRFSALSYRDRGLLRHQYRLQPDAGWTSSSGGTAAFQFPDLAAGRYAVEVRASVNGQHWTDPPARLSFEILPPWYRRAWALILFACASAAALYGTYRLRLAFLLRLERQRTRIAMDLHDEIGSGLGSINILAGLAAGGAPRDTPQADLIGEISDTAAELGASLGEIVWSLRSRSETLDGLVSHLSERAAKLFPGDRPSLGLAIPDSLPAMGLPLSVRWNVSLIAIEALHNAARHSHAGQVELGLAPAGRRWKLWVRDDGHGTAPVNAGSGMGFESMRRRAAEIGADLDVTTNQTGGVTVTLVFDPTIG